MIKGCIEFIHFICLIMVLGIVVAFVTSVCSGLMALVGAVLGMQ